MTNIKIISKKEFLKQNKKPNQKKIWNSIAKPWKTYIETKEKRKKAINEFFRVLTPNAEALISIWNSEDKRFKSVNYHGDVYMSWKENNILYMRYYYLFHNQEFLDLVKDTGFKILRFYEPREKDRFS